MGDCWAECFRWLISSVHGNQPLAVHISVAKFLELPVSVCIKPVKMICESIAEAEKAGTHILSGNQSF